MESYNPSRLPLVWILVTLISSSCTQAFRGNENNIKTAVFLTPKFVLGPGSVVNRFFYNAEFPKGHVALKSFNAELIDEEGKPVPLHETYLHHWTVEKYYTLIGNSSDYISGRNDGICQDEINGHFFGAGPETRKTARHVPDPYGLEIGNPNKIPTGFIERWKINVHAIDTRGVEDKLGCSECRCDLHNVTTDEFGKPLRPDYNGGFLCCYDGTQCRLKQGFNGIKRNLYLKYTVKWVNMDTSIVPIRIFIFDVTDKWKRSSTSTGINSEHDCQVEYEIEPCNATGLTYDECIDAKRVSLDMPFGGYLVYVVGHQHSAGTGSALYREDGQLLCSSIPIYGEGEEVGNEAGYIVGMSTYYPEPKTAKISKGETLILESNYSSMSRHTGVMGIFHVFVADQLPKPNTTLDFVAQVCL